MNAILFGAICDCCRKFVGGSLVTLVKKVSLHEMVHEWRIVAGDLERQEKWGAEVQAEKEGGGLEGMGSPS